MAWCHLLHDAVLLCCTDELGVNYVTLPFVQTAEDVMAARKVLDQHGGPRIKVWADCTCFTSAGMQHSSI
jgi:pyruvate kinase